MMFGFKIRKILGFLETFSGTRMQDLLYPKNVFLPLDQTLQVMINIFKSHFKTILNINTPSVSNYKHNLKEKNCPQKLNLFSSFRDYYDITDHIQRF
jgi:hypothetical protein